MGKRWYVAGTQPGLARIAEQELGRPYGDRPAFETLLPLSDRGAPVFGPYIFILIDLELDYWPPINGVRGVTRLLPKGQCEPSPLPDAFIADLKSRMNLGVLSEEAAAEILYAYADKEAVRITSGAFEGHRGEFVRKHKGLINVSMVLFNRQTTVPIPAHQVAPASPKAARG